MLIILFGHTGSGKNYVANILKQHYRFETLDADQLFTPTMLDIIKSGGVISPPQREEYIQSIINTVDEITHQKPNLVVTQAFVKQSSREVIKKAFPYATWIYITTSNEKRFERLNHRQEHFADANYAKIMDSIYDSPDQSIPVINNDHDHDPQFIIDQFDHIHQSLNLDLRSKDSLATRTQGLRASHITQILRHATGPNTVSLAGGHPAEETLPVNAIKKINRTIFNKHGGHILQYGQSIGYLPLRQQIVNYLKDRQIICHINQIGISSGAQNAIDATAKMLINHGDVVAIEPSTFYSIQTLGLYEPKIIEIESDDYGIIPDALDHACQKQSIKLIYLIPNFQNPTGRTMTIERRFAIAEIARKHHLYIIEDDPYYELRYQGESVPPIQTFAPELTIYIGSLSKIFSPAMRLGYYVAPKNICELITSIRQVDDIHANQYAQALACEFISQGYFEKSLIKILNKYRLRMNSMIQTLDKHLDKSQFSFSRPDGGLFIWVKGKIGFDALETYKKCLEVGVSFVPGNYFFID